MLKSHPKYALYTSHCMSAWGVRMWEFSVSLVLFKQYPDSFAAIAVAGIVMSLAQASGGPLVGRYLDRTPRLQGACTMYLLQNSAVAVSAISALLFLSLPDEHSWLETALVMAFIAGAGAADLGALGSTLAVEKEWVKCLAEGDSAQLTSMNATMRRIDLTCLLCAPMATGIVMTLVDTWAAVLMLAAWNLLAWAPECLLLKYACSCSDALSAERQERADEQHAAKCCAPVYTFAEGLQTYFTQDVCLTALALALLYCTVLSFGLLTTAYFKFLGLTEALLSVARGAGAITGLLATVTFPWLRARHGLAWTGVFSILAQLVCLAVAVVPQLTNAPKAVQLGCLLGGLICSRFGLWSFDLCVTQLLQERVANEILGLVNGVQGSLQQIATLLMFTLVLSFPSPSQYVWLMLGSMGNVTLAATLFCIWGIRHGKSAEESAYAYDVVPSSEESDSEAGTEAAQVVAQVEMQVPSVQKELGG